MQEESTNAPVDGLDLKGVPEALHDLMIALADDASAEAVASDIEAARRVMCNRDGSVVVKLTVAVKAGKEETERVHLRSLTARDYFDGTYGGDTDDASYMASLRLAARIAKPTSAVDALACPEDMKAVYYGVIALRKNFSSPKP